MKLIIYLLVFCSILFGCGNNDLRSKHISDISVVREVSSNSNASQTKETTTHISHQSKTRYHIIVASFSAKDKARAQNMVAQLKAKDYPASMLYSSKRYRVSIENFASEIEAKATRDKYSKDLDREDFWVHQVDN